MEIAKTENTTIEYVRKESEKVVEFVKSIEIVDDVAAEELKCILPTFQHRIQFAKDWFDPDIQKANELHKSLTGKRKLIVDPYTEALKLAKQKIGEYEFKQKEQERQKAIEQDDKEVYVPPAPAAKGWDAEIVDPIEVMKAIIKGKFPNIVKTWDIPLLTTLKKSGTECPGVKYTPNHSKGMRVRK